ncbi:AAA family ATPase [Leucothrix pacifica]|uniref:AAA family ATPase n=1 Tax=Leucothrix pacifica TaxID=1247513 RepID=A0A317CV98_9GAMM|nr:MoxR family ATPase [Leucothrix pacifica]PWR00263.1 AAA family ATPase [Leucothrix pacifica]
MQQKQRFDKLQQYVSGKIIGQSDLVNRLLVAMLADGHLLVEGAPGLAKTRAIQVLSEAVEGDFHRVQFTPDLLPADITGTEIFQPQTGEFEFRKGPLFHNLVLADEINRAPAKVQSALLEAMAERQITVAGVTYKLAEPFMVMATQNPIEQEGTYHLPEAQLDRFLMHVRVGYPNLEAEKQILHLNRAEALDDIQKTTHAPEIHITKQDISEARQQVMQLYMADSVEEYLLQLVMATRQPEAYSEELAGIIAFGASPRATMALDRCARAHAWLNGRDYVGPDDVQSIAHDVLRHRILLSFEGEASGKTSDEVIDTLLSLVAVP